MKKDLNPILELLIWIALGTLTLTVELCMVTAMVMIGIGLYIWQIWIDFKIHCKRSWKDIKSSHEELWNLFKKTNPRWRKDAAHGAKEFDPTGF